jgi:anti-sigma factor RsiW
MSWWTHRRIRRDVSAYLDGEVGAATASAVRANLRQCWACSGDAELTRMIKHSLHNLASRHDDVVALMRLRRRFHGAS